MFSCVIACDCRKSKLSGNTERCSEGNMFRDYEQHNKPWSNQEKIVPITVKNARIIITS